MAQRKDTKGKRSRKHLSEGSPNPHGESKVLQMPINTDQRNATGGRNIPQVPNTTGGELNPSVVHEFKRRVVSEEQEEKTTRQKKDA
jgi:hypothetical protein